MNTFFHYLKKALVGFTALVFAFIVIYTPQDFTKEAHAGAAGGGASEWTQLANYGLLYIDKAANVASSISTGLLDIKELTLDGVAWEALKWALSMLADQMITWVNNGFRGRPAFVQDIGDFLRKEADAVIGNYIESLGEFGSFLCDPFKIDIIDALEDINFYNRDSSGFNTPASCTLSDVIGNAEQIEDYISGSQGSFSRGGGWESWLEMTNSPETNTVLGSLGTVQSKVTERRLTKESEERTKLGWGNGFFSISTCNGEEGEAFRDDCKIATPGQLINQALNNNLDSNRQSLVAADELNEAVGAFFGMVASGGLVNLTNTVSYGSGDGGAAASAQTERTRLETEAEKLEEDSKTARDEVKNRAEEDVEDDKDYIEGEINGAVGSVVTAISNIPTTDDSQEEGAP
jgi:hypothetical protein